MKSVICICGVYVHANAVVKLCVRGYTYVGGTDMCANERRWKRSLDVGFTNVYVWERKIIHHVRGHRSWQWWTDDVLGIVSLWMRARHKIDERL